jgi:hypothetical protein|tara:strand:- start:750 stop:911 length:162 start_codon:yes stop_codon:yes gene_type:complete
MRYILKVGDKQLIRSDDKYEIKKYYDLLKSKNFKPTIVERNILINEKEMDINE